MRLLILVFAVCAITITCLFSNNKVIASDSTSIVLINPQPHTIYILYQQMIHYPATNVEQQTYNSTNGICPTNFTPYVTMLPSKVYSESQGGFGGWGSQTLSGFGVCINSNISALSDSTGYTWTYLTSMRSGTFKRGTDRTSADIAYDYDTGAGPVYGASSYGGGSGSKIAVPSYYNNPATANQFWDVGGIVVTIYCFPPGVTPPTPANSPSYNCTAGHSPF